MFGALTRPPVWTSSSNISRTTFETWSTYVNGQSSPRTGSRRRRAASNPKRYGHSMLKVFPINSRSRILLFSGRANACTSSRSHFFTVTSTNQTIGHQTVVRILSNTRSVIRKSSNTRSVIRKSFRHCLNSEVVK